MMNSKIALKSHAKWLAIGSLIFAMACGSDEAPSGTEVDDDSKLRLVDADSLDWTMEVGDSDRDQFGIANDGEGQLEFDIHTDAEWLTIDPVDGEVAGDADVTIDVEATCGDEAGDFDGVIVIESNDPDAEVVEIDARLSCELLAPGTLSVFVEGLDGEEFGADITIDVPDDFSERIEETTSFDDAPVGTYEISAESVGDDAVCEPEPTEKSVELAREGTVEATFDYQVVTGGIDVEVTGLPDELEHAIEVVGPDGERRAVPQDGLVEDLEPGRYNIFPSQVFDGTTAYEASEADVDVVSGDIEQVEIEYFYDAGSIAVDVRGLPETSKAEPGRGRPATPRFLLRATTTRPLKSPTNSSPATSSCPPPGCRRNTTSSTRSPTPTEAPTTSRKTPSISRSTPASSISAGFDQMGAPSAGGGGRTLNSTSPMVRLWKYVPVPLEVAGFGSPGRFFVGDSSRERRLRHEERRRAMGHMERSAIALAQDVERFRFEFDDYGGPGQDFDHRRKPILPWSLRDAVLLEKTRAEGKSRPDGEFYVVVAHRILPGLKVSVVIGVGGPGSDHEGRRGATEDGQCVGQSEGEHRAQLEEVDLIFPGPASSASEDRRRRGVEGKLSAVAQTCAPAQSHSVGQGHLRFRGVARTDVIDVIYSVAAVADAYHG